ncbi:EF-hand domain-containing protein [Kordiimonas pumila]|uniref:EF-hand domain-containing protein n=1 Tax=Kordiimonas pumila TaxID=2161677 RepID=A0ABV7D7X1_9PROT|nr:hypothetical protein [Kordiimonas pumila]
MTKRYRLVLVTSLVLAIAACSSNRKGPPKPPPIPPEKAAEMQRRFLDQWDTNNDGLFSCDDITHERRKLFITLDLNQDALLDEQEYRRAQFEDKGFMFFRFEQLDKNANNMLELAEFAAVEDSTFQSMDHNGDCLIDQGEAMAFMVEKQRRRGRPEPGKGDRSPPRRMPDEGGVDPF